MKLIPVIVLKSKLHFSFPLQVKVAHLYLRTMILLLHCDSSVTITTTATAATPTTTIVTTKSNNDDDNESILLFATNLLL